MIRPAIAMVLVISTFGCGPTVREQVAIATNPAAADTRGADAEVKLEELAKWRDDYNDKLVATVGDKQAKRKLDEESNAYLKSIAGKKVAGFAQFRRISVNDNQSTFVQLMYPHDRDSGVSVKVSQANADKLRDLQTGEPVFAHGLFASDGGFYVVGEVEKK
jgi:hypothetical protein